MELAQSLNLVDILINLDQYLVAIITNYGTWAYLILFLVIFCETGLVVTPFLPGDSLLFLLGALAASGDINLLAIAAILMFAAVAGNMVNYQIGYYIGPRVFRGDKIRFLNQEHLMRTHDFYERHGGKTIVIARFLPIIRTFAPFVAGIGRMDRTRFFLFNLLGSVSWVSMFLWGGWAFGNIPVVERNLSLIVLGIISITLLPAFVAFLKQKLGPRPQKRGCKAET
ncbi:MAG TPA: DedA family protein [Syntrophomonadaceae bacterium]|nr:DedA family protein [Syntrophomonadaceae bacterium]